MILSSVADVASSASGFLAGLNIILLCFPEILVTYLNQILPF